MKDELYGLYLNAITPEELLHRINAYRSLDLRTVSDQLLRETLAKILKFQLVKCCTYSSGHEFYRARLLSDNKLLTTSQDLSYPPVELIKSRGRLNEAGESILYVSEQPTVLISELRLKPGEVYCIIKYKLKEEQTIEAAEIATDPETVLDRTRWTARAKKNFLIFTEFLKVEFTKLMETGSEFVYRGSCLIAKQFFNPPNDNDGWRYPSIVHKGGYNLALKPETVDRSLDFVGLRVCRYIGTDSQGKVNLMISSYWANTIEENQIQYHTDKPCPVVINGLSLMS